MSLCRMAVHLRRGHRNLIGRMHTNEVTLEQLAAHLGWTKSYCSMILNSQRKPRGIREKMEAAVSELIKEKENKTA